MGTEAHMHMKIAFGIVFATLGLSACVGAGSQSPAPVAAYAPPVPAAPDLGPVLGSDGRCIGKAATTATLIAPGIGECELVRLKGKAPTDVLVGEGNGTRETQVLYSEPGGREVYLFVNNRLDRVVK